MELTNEQWKRIGPVISSLTPKKRSKRSATEGSTGRVEWNIVDSQNWRALEGSAPAVSAIPNVPSAVPAMGQTRRFPRHYQRAG